MRREPWGDCVVGGSSSMLERTCASKLLNSLDGACVKGFSRAGQATCFGEVLKPLDGA